MALNIVPIASNTTVNTVMIIVIDNLTANLKKFHKRIGKNNNAIIVINNPNNNLSSYI